MINLINFLMNTKKMKNFISYFAAICTVLLISSFAAFAQSDDVVAPSDVDVLEASPLDSAIHLSWEAATDDVAVTGYQVHYGTTPVKEKGESYDLMLDVGDVLEFTVNDLENDTPYYFSVIAYDAAGNESAAWAPEQSETPSVDSGSSEDSDAPQVADAEAINDQELKVTFSEAIVLPTELAESSFLIENEDNFEPLDVFDAVLDENDGTQKTVILTTAVQEESVSYKLTVGSDISDKSGNFIQSGTSDTAIFTGSSLAKPSDDTEAPVILSVESFDNTHIIVYFNETVILGIPPTENFSIVTEDNADEKLEILKAEMGLNNEEVEDAGVILTTSPQSSKNYLLMAIDLEDNAGNLTDAGVANYVFPGTGDDNVDITESSDTTDINDELSEVEEVEEAELIEVVDVDSPKEAANLIIKKVFDAGKYLITLNWTIPGEDGITKQAIYLSTDQGKKYSKKSTLESDSSDYELGELEPGDYWFKLTQIDEDGNETDGVIAKVKLSETGPGLVGLLLVSFGLGGVVTKKKKK